VIAERNRYKEMVAERDTQLADLKTWAKDNEVLKAQIAELQAKNKQVTEDYEKQLKDQRFAFAVERAVAKADARNVKAVMALLDKTKISLDGENLLGFDEQVAALKESDPYLFGVELKGRVPEGTGKPRRRSRTLGRKRVSTSPSRGKSSKPTPNSR